ncbi:hypothetical protein AQUCO_06700039v1 [Aquilegia coerulea]|uniref:F-box domain-containing protein n=1 Tax=Aquilegia coerulea TaxID=218851 RepID=A0A2G5CD41_AQUCA|nr:hypothetical protein AQUCO_06700039v1 [Aquilegia coerulea]
MDNENSSSASTSASDFIPNKRLPGSSCDIPTDMLVFGILRKLSVKTLCRLKCVSKDCCTLIEKREYVDKNQPKQPFKFAIHDTDHTVFTCSVSRDGSTTTQSHEYDTALWDFRYCNGLISYFGIIRGSYVLCLSNPTTNQNIEVNSPTQQSIKYCHHELGFNPSSNKYKILIWEQVGTVYPPTDCYVRTLEEGSSWKPVNNIPHVLSRLEESSDYDRPKW